jgi:hypothetical protein
MLAVWQRADEEAEAAKDGYFAIKLLTEFYGDLNEEERQFANEVIQDWLISPDAKMRFDAVALAHTFRILELIPTLKDLAVMLSARGTVRPHGRNVRPFYGLSINSECPNDGERGRLNR